MFPALKCILNSVTIAAVKPNFNLLGSSTYRQYAAEAKKPKPTTGGLVKEFPVEKDPHKLVNYVCGSNIYREGEDVKLKPESEYPDWLWEIRTGPAPKLNELDPNSKEYWLKVRILARRKKNKMHKLKYKILKQF